MNIKMLFWKTYKATATHTTKNQYSVSFFRGFTWEVVQSAAKWVEEKRVKEKDENWALTSIERIY